MCLHDIFCYFNRLVYFGVSVKRLISCGILILIMCIFIVPKAGQNAYILNTIDSAREELVTFKNMEKLNCVGKNSYKA